MYWISSQQIQITHKVLRTGIIWHSSTTYTAQYKRSKQQEENGSDPENDDDEFQRSDDCNPRHALISSPSSTQNTHSQTHTHSPQNKKKKNKTKHAARSTARFEFLLKPPRSVSDCVCMRVPCVCISFSYSIFSTGLVNDKAKSLSFKKSWSSWCVVSGVIFISSSLKTT